MQVSRRRSVILTKNLVDFQQFEYAAPGAPAESETTL